MFLFLTGSSSALVSAGARRKERLAVGSSNTWRSLTKWDEAASRQVANQEVLIGGLEHFLLFHILGIIIPTD